MAIKPALGDFLGPHDWSLMHCLQFIMFHPPTPPTQTFHKHCFQFLPGTIPVTPKEIEKMLTSVTFGEQTGSTLALSKQQMVHF